MAEATTNARHSIEAQQALVLARLRSYGPSFDHELTTDCRAPDPAAIVASLCADGYRIETLRTWRPLIGAWSSLYVLRVKDQTGAVVAAPLPLGAGLALERWNEPDQQGGARHA
ncbi:MAG: hypothetical protein Q7V09_20810 [Hydrogenophaga sp.]|uniref:hypothetical protein n=1 Tax=Hydrogenophaga sp. TaxID=1904254 RepID=UPI002728E0AD|nr:hypothetical protein [Hydrogenophaga sp.]MDO9032876.1 hypothetical protein [Hydrogenophaga sp.]